MLTLDDSLHGVIAQISSGLFHDLNNKLGPILLDADCIAMSFPSAREAARRIKDNTLAIVETIHAVETLTAANLGRRASFDTVVRCVEGALRGVMRRRGVVFDVEKDDAPGYAVADPRALVCMLVMSPFAFVPSMERVPARLRVSALRTGRSTGWRVDADPPLERDEEGMSLLERICEGNGWIFEGGFGWIAVDVAGGA